ncbi:MAG: hypothetical protein QOD84_1012 [Acidobacteriaceae bacterium]|jgi:hypothetical protein
MIKFVCDSCNAVKEPSEAWIVGIAAESVGAVSARREVTILSSWDRTNALHPLAVHFCSVQCQEEFKERLFGPDSGRALADEIQPRSRRKKSA